MERIRSSLIEGDGRTKRWLTIPRKRRRLPNRQLIRRKRQRKELLSRQSRPPKPLPLRPRWAYRRSPLLQPSLPLPALPQLPRLQNLRPRLRRLKKDRLRSITNLCNG